MSQMYAMRRANGDWFAINDQGRSRVPVFRSNKEAMQARALNPGMLLFRPVELDESMLDDLMLADDETDVYFWLSDNPAENVNRGQTFGPAQLALMISGAAQQLQE